MRFLVIFALLFLFGCVDVEDRGNVTEENITNITEPEPPPKQFERYNAVGFSFEYPINMEVDYTPGIFTATRKFDGTTAEIMIVTHLDTLNTYGPNKEKIFQAEPTKTSADFLKEDLEDDPTSVLDDAFEIGEISTLSIQRDAYVSDVKFKIKFNEGGRTYTGYALSLYVPERRMHIKERIIEINNDMEEKNRDNFVSSFRIS
jgi:hypothetical protein